MTKGRATAILAALVFVATFLLYLRTLAPSVYEMFDDSAELQLVAYQLGIAHPTGYPLYTLLGKMFTLLPFGDPAYRVNLMSAFWGASAVALLFLVTKQVCERALKPLPEFTEKVAPFALTSVALFFATTPTFWFSATTTEVYTFNAFFVGLVLVLALCYGERKIDFRLGTGKGGYLLAFVYGLSLTHHRTMLLFAPALLVYGLLSRTSLFGKGPWTVKNIAVIGALFVLPLTLYLYLPIRGSSITSLDGTYENTVSGFLKWVTASGYGTFFTSNPWGFGENPAITYGRSLLGQLSWLGGVLGLVGIIRLFKNARVWLLLTISLAATIIFALIYRVADPEPFYLPSYYLIAVLIGVGIIEALEAAQWGLRAIWLHIRPGTVTLQPRLARTLPLLVGIVMLAVPVSNTAANIPQFDLSGEDTVLNYGLDILSQPIATNSAIVGIGGEITLLKYLQATRGMRTDLTFITADDEAKRRAEISARIEQGQSVYTTRPLPGLADKYALHSVGPLVRVLPVPATDVPQELHALTEKFGGSIELIGYKIEESQDGPMVVTRGMAPRKAKPALRLTLFWRDLEKVPDDLSVFVHLEDPSGRLVGQKDGSPVNGAYPTSRWRKGEVVEDTYDVPLLIGTPPGNYEMKVGLYDSKGNRLSTASGANQAALGPLRLVRTVVRTASSAPDAEKADAKVLDNLKVVGYKLGSGSARPGDSLRIDLLWQATDRIPEEKTISLWLIGSRGEKIAEYPALPTEGRYPMTRWSRNEIVRDMRTLTLPADLADGIYQIAVDTASGKLAPLACFEVMGRQRVFDVPSLDKPLSASFDERITLLGYNLAGTGRSALSAGDKLGFTLYWQSRGKIGVNYTVFVHFIGPDGRPITQDDAVPQRGNAPTLSWVEKEVVADSHELTVPAGTPQGEYRVLVGLYDPATGTRLKTAGSDNVSLGIWTVR